MLVETHLRDAAVALAAGRDTEGFRALLDAWLASGSLPELADAISTVGERLAPRHPDDPHLGALRRVEAIRTPLELTMLQEPTWPLHRDPRVQRLALRWLEEARFSTGPDATGAYVRIVNALTDARGAEAQPRLAALFAAVRADAAHPLRRDGTSILRALARAVTKEHAPPPPLSAEGRALLDAIVAGVAPSGRPMAVLRDGDELLAAVWADPARDEPRLVYADWLSERGDPRGELIVLQCERARRGGLLPSERETALLRRHLAEWLGPLGKVIYADPRMARFERGFVAAAELSSYVDRAAGDPLPGLVGHPAWSTVVELDLNGEYQREPRFAPLLLGGALRSLRVVRRVSIADGERLVAADLSALGWTRLGFCGWGDAHRTLAARLDGLPALEALGLGWLSVAQLDEVLATRVGRRLVELGTDGPEPLPEWAAAARRLLGAGPLERLRHDSGQHRVLFTRHPSGGLAVTAALGPNANVRTFSQTVALLAPDAVGVAAFTLVPPYRRRAARSVELIESLRAAFGARFSLSEAPVAERG